MPGKHITDANAATIEALHKILQVGVIGGIIIVDSVKGNDIKAASDSSIPYKTITAAKTSATAGKTIVVMPATYDENDLAKDGINYVFMPGAIVNYTGVSSTGIFDDNNSVISINVYGNGQFISKQDIVVAEAVGTIMVIHGDKIYSSEHRALANYEGTVTLYVKDISSYDGVLDNIGSTNGNCHTVVYADKITGIGNYVIEHDGGKVEVFCREIISLSDTFPAITTASGNGSLFLECKKLTANYYGIENLNDTTTVYLKGIQFEVAEADVMHGSKEQLITVDSCSSYGVPYLKGKAGLNYIHRPLLKVTNNPGDWLNVGYEPDTMILESELITWDIYTTRYEMSFPENYYLETWFIETFDGVDGVLDIYLYGQPGSTSFHHGFYGSEIYTPTKVKINAYNGQGYFEYKDDIINDGIKSLFVRADNNNSSGLKITLILKRFQ